MSDSTDIPKIIGDVNGAPDGKDGDLESVNKAIAAAGEQVRGNMSAATLARLAGLATVTDLKLMGGKVDLLLSRINALSARMEKILGVLSSAPTGSDLERIDVQIGSLKTLIKEALAGTPAAGEGTAKQAVDSGHGRAAPKPARHHQVEPELDKGNIHDEKEQAAE